MLYSGTCTLFIYLFIYLFLLFRRKLSLLWEVVLLSRNASEYNETDSVIVHNSKVLTQTLLKFIK